MTATERPVWQAEKDVWDAARLVITWPVSVVLRRRLDRLVERLREEFLDRRTGAEIFELEASPVRIWK